MNAYCFLLFMSADNLSQIIIETYTKYDLIRSPDNVSISTTALSPTQVFVLVRSTTLLPTNHPLFYTQFKIDYEKKTSFDGFLTIYPERQRQGIGRRLVQAREEICIAEGIDLIVINKQSIPKFWKKCGYKPLTFFQRWRRENKIQSINYSGNWSTLMYKELYI